MGHCVPKVRAHLAIQQVCVLLAEHFLVILEDAVAGPGAHEVEVAGQEERQQPTVAPGFRQSSQRYGQKGLLSEEARA